MTLLLCKMEIDNKSFVLKTEYDPLTRTLSSPLIGSIKLKYDPSCVTVVVETVFMKLTIPSSSNN